MVDLGANPELDVVDAVGGSFRGCFAVDTIGKEVAVL